MALSERQSNAVLSLFVKTFASVAPEQRKDVYMEFADTFIGELKEWEAAIKSAFIREGIASDIISEWQRIEEEREHKVETCEICKMQMADEDQIVKLLIKELGCMPHYADCNEIGTVKDFEATEYSFVAKKDNEVVGVLMAQKIMEYGSYYIFIDNLAVTSEMQGRGIGKQLIEQLIREARKNEINKIMLYTEKNRKAYDIYHHMGFQDQRDDAVYMTKWFI